jgi:ribonucleotide monophosphatase NagD (HAD superfamily)
MSIKWLVTMKPSFQSEWLALPPKEAHQVLEKIQQPVPHILYTTYTNALVRSSDQQLKELLGVDSACVKVMTADMIVWNILSSAERKLNVARDSTLIGAIERALQQLQSEGSTHPRVLERY